jgi:hypothetical protein
MKKTSIASTTLLSLAANLALAAGVHQAHDHEPAHDQPQDDHAVSAPEIDPSQAMGALVLLGGTVAVIRGYRRNKK